MVGGDERPRVKSQPSYDVYFPNTHLPGLSAKVSSLEVRRSNMIGASLGMAVSSGGLLVAPEDPVEAGVVLEPPGVGVGGVEPMAAEAAWNLSA